MLDEVMRNTNEYVNSFPKQERKKYGQFFTPVATARYMAKLSRNRNEKVRILDPGAGNGILTAALIERLVENGYVREVTAVLYENDNHIQGLLYKNIAVMRKYCKKQDVKLQVKVIKDNFILCNHDYWDRANTRGLYDIVICNPPYQKIGKDTAESVCMNKIVYGQPNLYFLFMAMATKLLHQQGEFIFITPRSWTSGLYFKSFRRWFFQKMDIQYAHLFHSRSNVFKENRICNDSILQETMITCAVRSARQSEWITIASCEDADSFSDTQYMRVLAENCLTKTSERFFLLPLGEDDLVVLDMLQGMPNSVVEAGFRFKTGQVVEFRNQEYISNVFTGNEVPLLHSCNILDGKIVFPVDTEKPQYFRQSEKSNKNIMDNRNTVFLKRATAKEEARRLQPALHIADNFRYSRLSAENHLNYLVKIGDELSLCEVYGFYTILRSDIWERYYRMLNGSTQVNSEELNSMPIPNLHTLQHIGRMAMHYWKELQEDSISSDEIIRRALM